MGRNIIVVGCQWGDEGKGKVVDLLAEKSDIIARFQGGANAGHTIHIEDKRLILHLVPSGVTHPGKICYIGNGVVVDPFGLLEEIDSLHTQGIDTAGRLFISAAANLVMPYHKLIDVIEENRRGGDCLGTTLRGIGPAYRDKVARWGIRVADLQVPQRLRAKLDNQVKTKAEYLAGNTDERADMNKTYDALMNIAPRFREIMVDVSLELQKQNRQGKKILFEGAQGAMLDIDLGTYPFTTSSNTTVGGALTGLGVGPSMIGEVMGIVKAYTTRVGGGPFPTELMDDIAVCLREAGSEYGATTGRARRVGWLDLVSLRHACRINGVDSIAVTKLDVLGCLDKIQVCTQYENDGFAGEDVPLDLATLSQVKPVYREFPGWKTDICGITDYSKLPAAARNYLDFIAEALGVRIALVSTGSRRSDTIMMND